MLRVNVIPGHFYIVTKKSKMIDLGNIDSINSEYTAKASSPTPITSQPLENAYAYDTGVTHKITVSFTRGQNNAVQNTDGTNTFPYDDMEAYPDSTKWTNGYFSYVIYLIVNRWQMNTDGIGICYCPISNESKVIGKVIARYANGTADMYCLNAYISSYSPSYTTSEFTRYHADLTFSIGSITMTTIFEGYIVEYHSSFGTGYTETTIVKVCDEDSEYKLIDTPDRWASYAGKSVAEWRITKDGTTKAYAPNQVLSMSDLEQLHTDGKLIFTAVMS